MLCGAGSNREQNEGLLLVHLFLKHASEVQNVLGEKKKLKSWKPVLQF